MILDLDDPEPLPPEPQEPESTPCPILADNFYFLREGEEWKKGDEYGVGFCFTIGGPHTSIKPGSKIDKGMLCYLPRRPKTPEEEERRRAMMNNGQWDGSPYTGIQGITGNIGGIWGITGFQGITGIQETTDVSSEIPVKVKPKLLLQIIREGDTGPKCKKCGSSLTGHMFSKERHCINKDCGKKYFNLHKLRWLGFGKWVSLEELSDKDIYFGNHKKSKHLGEYIVFSLFLLLVVYSVIYFALPNHGLNLSEQPKVPSTIHKASALKQ